MQTHKQLKHNFPIREIPKQRFRSKSYFPKAVESVSSNSWSSLCGDSASYAGSSKANSSSGSTSTSSNSLSGATSQRQTKNSEHESGYYEDLSDVEEQRGTNVVGTKPKHFASADVMRYFTLTVGLNKLEMRDSPASPDPEQDDGEVEQVVQEGENGQEAMISSVLATPRACNLYKKGKCPRCRPPIKKLLHFKKFYMNRDSIERANRKEVPSYRRSRRDQTARLMAMSHVKINLLTKINTHREEE